MNAQLGQALARARIELAGAPSGHLDLPARDEIWRAMGAYETAPGHRAIRGPGLLRRTRLCMLCVERVLPVFAHAQRAAGERLVRAEDEPRALLDFTREYLEGRCSWDEAWQRSMRFGTMLQHAHEMMPHHARAALVLHASGATLGTALKDMGEYGGTTRDRDLDAWDANTYACWAEVGVAPWEPRGGARRRAFWEWYLGRAVPRAFER